MAFASAENYRFVQMLMIVLWVFEGVRKGLNSKVRVSGVDTESTSKRSVFF